VSYRALLNRIRALEAQFSPRGVTIKIEGGLPPDFKMPAEKPRGSDLKHQHESIVRPARARKRVGGSSGTPEGV